MSRITKITRIIIWFLLAGTVCTAIVASSAYLYLSPKLPPVDVLRDVKLQTPLKIYTADRQLIGQFGEKRRTPINFDQIPDLFVKAVLAAEDSRFFEHHGVDINGLLRAVSQLLLTGEKSSGGSTITMQVARNYFLSLERTYTRKFNEILLSFQIEKELPKNEIFELYVNKIFLGNRAYGIEAASQVYYGQSISELNLAQLAMIAGLPKAPSTFNPLVNPTRAMVRRNWILGRMLSLKYISNAEYQVAVDSPITASYHGSSVALDAPYAAEMARKELLQLYGRDIYTSGYSVYTTLDSKLQASAQQAVINGLFAYDNRHGYRGPEQNIIAENPEDLRDLWVSTLNKIPPVGNLVAGIVASIDEQAFTTILSDGSEVVVNWEPSLKNTRPYISMDKLGPRPKQAKDIVSEGDLIRLQQDPEGNWQLSQIPAAQASLVSLNADNGGILSLVGGFNYQQSKFNRITQATRQPGSNFKPFVYTAALANGYTPASIINDAPIVFEDASLESSWRPTNDSGKFYGPTRLRYALFKSRNLVSIRLLRGLGISKAVNYVERFGFNPSQLPRDLSLALGSHSVTPMQVVQGYATLANGGFAIKPYLVDRIEDVNGDELYQAIPDTVCRSCETEEVPPEPEIIEEEFATIEDILEQPSELEQPAELPLPQAERVIEPRVAYMIDSMLKDVVKKGTGRKAMSLGRNDLAGKTGTTNGPTDAWFSGYGGGIVTTAWLGFDKNGLLGRKEYGGSAALPIWIDFMETALENRPEFSLQQPAGLVSVKIDPETGLLAKPGQRNALFEIFPEELVPVEASGNGIIGSDSFDSEEVMLEDIF